MKNKLLLFVVFAFIASPVFGQFTFSVSPGFNLNTASFGYKINKIVPYAGFQMINAKFALDETRYEWDYGLGEAVGTNIKIDVKAGIYIPTIGAKYFIVEQNKLKAFIGLSLMKPILKAKIDAEEDGVAVESTQLDIIESTINDIKMFGGELGFGVEYFFDDNFSVGGEFGLRYLKNKLEMSEDNEIGPNPDNFPTTRSIDLNLMPTFTKISLNFYFGGAKE